VLLPEVLAASVCGLSQMVEDPSLFGAVEANMTNLKAMRAKSNYSRSCIAWPANPQMEGTANTIRGLKLRRADQSMYNWAV
jgi:hypothetical protein